jgi:Family of unknown function (DUF6232)
MASCASCGAALSSVVSFCGSCGTPVPALPPSAANAPRTPGRPAEQTFFQSGGVLVTNTRFVRGSETFAMSGVTSVSSFTEVPSKKWPIVIMILGALALLGGITSSVGAVVFGVILIAVGVLWWRSIKDVHHVRLVTASGEKDALSSTDQAYIGKIVGAISEAIVHRG